MDGMYGALIGGCVGLSFGLFFRWLNRRRLSAGAGEHCQACGSPYETVYWLPDDLWAVVAPKPENLAAGTLCPRCVDARARAAGVELAWTAGVLT